MRSTFLKLALAPLLLVIACLVAGCYGAVHNQISFTVSPHYFTDFKFRQFNIDPDLSPRIGAAVVGWLASWWMGIVIGAILIPVGLIIPRPGAYLVAMLRVFGVVAVTTLMVGLLALAISFLVVDEQSVVNASRTSGSIADEVAFARAGVMHTFSYVGGLAGIISGLVAVFRVRKRRA